MDRVKICKTKANLDSIKKTDTELVILKRSLATDFQNWIDHTDSEYLPNFRILVNLSDLRQALEFQLENSGLKSENMRKQLEDDICSFVIMFADITQSKTVDVRLQRIRNNACWRFHRDVVETRLLTTYRGPSTEWVQNRHAEQALVEQLEYRGPIEQLGHRDVAIFKGSCNRPNRGIVHRSTAIKNT